MAIQEVKLPDVGEGVVEGELVKWLVKVGDKIQPDQPVVEVMTDKATVEVPSPISGTVKELKAKEGDMVPIESVLLLVESEKTSAENGVKKTSSPPVAPINGLSKEKNGNQSGTHGGGAASLGFDIHPPVVESKVLATPATRRLAREMGVDLNQIAGTGLVGRVTRDDVLAQKNVTSLNLKSVNVGIVASTGEERVPLRGIRKKIAENMQMSKRVIPHFTLVEEAHVTELVRFRQQVKVQAEKVGVKVTYLPFVMKALMATIREFPMFNASIEDQSAEIVYKKYFNLGFAADTPQGLMVPVVKSADNKSLLQLSREIQDLAGKARQGKLALDEMKGATITITNIGSVAGLFATPIINHPEVAILGMYKIQDVPVWNGESFVRGQKMNFSITCDHRLIDGAVAANFMKAFIQRIENPSVLMLDMI